MPLTPQQLADFQRLRQSYAPVVEAQRRKQQAQANLEKMHGLPPVKPQPKADGGSADANLAQFLEGSHTPMRLYHGTTATEGGKRQEAVRRLKPSKEGAFGPGVYMTPDTEYATGYTGIPAMSQIKRDIAGDSDYARTGAIKMLDRMNKGEVKSHEVGGNMLPLHARILNPLVVDMVGPGDPNVMALMTMGVSKDKAYDIVEKAYEKQGGPGKHVYTRAKALGHDAMIIKRNGKIQEVIHYNPKMIKSAIGNRGTYDTTKDDLSMAKGGLAKQPLVLYHASDADFDQFDPSMNRTARHIYTSEHPEQAMPYGKHLHTIHATPKMFLDATAEDKSTVAKLKKAAKDAGITDQYYPFEDFHEHFKNGDVYQHSGGQRTMNALLHELFGKHDAIKIPDAIVGGGVGSSVVFKDPKLLKIVNPNNPDITKAKGGKIEVRPTVFDDAASRRNPKIEEAARALLAGNIKQKDYEKLVAKEKPVKPYSFIPKPATDEQAMKVLIERQKQNWRSHESWPAGHPVGLRLDIPAYERHGVWVNSVHDESGQKPAFPTSYGPVSSVRNAEFHGSPHKAARVATGEQSKTPFARIMGNIEHMDEEQAVKHFQKYMNHPDYRQIGYDPRRHGDFYDRETMQPVTHSEHVVQIGPLVLAKKPKYGKRTVYAKGGKVTHAHHLEIEERPL